jgi:beta-glucosidase
VDSYHRWREDMELLAGAGLTDYRFGVEWSRIEPADGRMSRASVQRYRRMVEYAIGLGIRRPLSAWACLSRGSRPTH